jgi:uncharacterized protein YkwD
MRGYLFAIPAFLLGLSAPQAKGDCTLMQKLAQEHSNSMARRNIMDHAGFENRARRGAKAENVAYGAATRTEAMAMWLASPPHLANLLLPGCRGVASAVSRSGIRYWTMEIAKTGAGRARHPGSR